MSLPVSPTGGTTSSVNDGIQNLLDIDENTTATELIAEAAGLYIAITQTIKIWNEQRSDNQ